MKAINKYLVMAALLILTISAMPPTKKIRVWMIGDSTMCLYDSTHSPINGWGMPFANFFDSTVTVINKAKGGRSTRTFIREHRWQEIEADLQEGDYVQMQYGHNDEAKEPIYRDRYTSVPDYIENLVRFITETRNKKAIPILITPVTRMVFDQADNISETHKDYSAAVLDIGKKYGVPVVDLDAMSRQLLQQLGPQYAKMLFMQLDPLENPHYPEGQKDNTHFNEYGARRMAELVLADMQRQHIPLTKHIFRPMQLTPSLTGLTGIPDTSFNMNTAYLSTKKTNPETKWMPKISYRSVKVDRDLEYCSAGSRRLLLDVFHPAAGASKNRTAIVIIFGGGWRSGNRTMFYPLAEKLASLGYVCFTPDYRLSTEALYPAGIYDIKAAIRWVRQHATEYNVDSSRVVSLGFSAGGEMAAFIGTTGGMPSYTGDQCPGGNSDSVNAVVDIDGTLSFISPEGREGNDSGRPSAATYWFGYPRKDNPRLWETASPITYADEHTPPTLFVNSSLSWMHAGRTDYINVLDKYHRYSEVHSFEGAPHCFCLFDPWFTPTVGYIDGFLKKVFKQ
jgi:acetyl esterase/lipase/lysophospholipase L1-like esterase